MEFINVSTENETDSWSNIEKWPLFANVSSTEEVPSETKRIAEASFPNGNGYMSLRDEYGTLFNGDNFSDLYSWKGGEEIPAEILATVTVLQYSEGLSDREAADQVRSRIDWKYLLGVEITYSGFHFSALSRFRSRLLESKAEGRLLEIPLEKMKEMGLLKGRGSQRTDSTHVLAQIRTLNRLELAGETMRQSLNELSILAPEWLSRWIPEEWYARYGLRMEQYRLPKGVEKREAFLTTMGEDGYQLISAIYHPDAPSYLIDSEAVQALRLIWIQQYNFVDDKCTPRKGGNMPSGHMMINSPYDLEARYSVKRTTTWTGYKVHVTETCDQGQPRLITHIETTPATESDCVTLPTIHQALKAKGLLPNKHLVDGGYVDVANVVESQQNMNIEIIGPVRPDTSWQAKDPDAYDISQFQIDWVAQSVTCPQGYVSQVWSPTTDRKGGKSISVRFQRSDCQQCPVRILCTTAQSGPRGIKLQPSQELHQSIQDDRIHQRSQAFRDSYKPRAGIEGTISQATRAFDLRRTRFIGQIKTRLQHLATATAINLARIYQWWTHQTPEATRTSSFLDLKTYHAT